ncbi:MAG: hypothetical protein Q7V88_16965 [Actinomycetota bacterium]|nr:hypothetical protein [Actinomycetota bacterium]
MLGAVVVLIAGAVTVLFVMRGAGAKFAVDSIAAPDSVVTDDAFEVGVLVRNNGDESGTQELTLSAGGVALGTQTVQLDAGAEVTITFDVDGLEPGNYELTVDKFTGVQHSLWVMTSPRFVIDELVVSPETVDPMVDPTVTVTVRYSNLGEADGTHTLELTVDGRTVQRRDTSLPGGGSGEEVFTLTMDTPGHPVIGVGDTTTPVWVLAPPELVIDSVGITPSPANFAISHDVTVLVAFSNVGESEGAFTLDVMLDGQVVQSRGVTLAGGASSEEQFILTVANPGLHGLNVNGSEALFDVYQIERPSNGTILVNEIGGGSNRLTIDNQRDEDVYVVLTAPGEGQPTLLGVYVQAGSSYTVRNIREGAYATYFVHGTDWCSFYHRFTVNADYGMFDEDSSFESSSSTYTIITLTFGATDGAWSPTSSVDPDEFPTA